MVGRSKSCQYGSFLKVSSGNKHTSCLMISSNNNQGIFVLPCKFECFAYCHVKVNHLATYIVNIISMRAKINLRTFNHQEKSLFIISQNSYGSFSRNREHII